MAPGTAILALWVAWLFSWLLAAVWSRRTRVQPSGFDQLRYGIWIWFGALLIFWSSRLSGGRLRPIYSPSPIVGWAALPAVAFGLGWTWWARIHLGSLWSSLVTLKVDHRVVRTGPYRITRHPIYSGILFALLATAFVRDSWPAIAGWLLVLSGFIIKLRQEERLLSSALGSEYAKYRSEVPALVPGVW